MDSAASEDREEDELIPLSALQHAVYCLRQAALIHIERLWEENAFTAKGRVLHQVAEKPGSRKARGVRRVMAMVLSSKRMGLVGVADLVEFVPGPDGSEIPYPVEYKRGKPKLHRADEVQLCAQALCLEEMTRVQVTEGALYYGEIKRRQVVSFDEELRNLTEKTSVALAEVFKSRKTPPPTHLKQRCRACSLHDLCKPELAAKPAKAWRDAMLARLLAEDGQTS